MDTIATGVFVLILMVLFVCFVGTLLFVSWSAIKWLRTKKELEKVNIFDGIDASEMKIIADLISRKKQADQETKVRTDAVEALKL